MKAIKSFTSVAGIFLTAFVSFKKESATPARPAPIAFLVQSGNTMGKIIQKLMGYKKKFSALAGSHNSGIGY